MWGKIIDCCREFRRHPHIQAVFAKNSCNSRRIQVNQYLWLSLGRVRFAIQNGSLSRRISPLLAAYVSACRLAETTAHPLYCALELQIETSSATSSNRFYVDHIAAGLHAVPHFAPN